MPDQDPSYLDVLLDPDTASAAAKARAVATALRQQGDIGRTLSILGDKRLRSVGEGMQSDVAGQEKNLLNAAIAREHYGAETRNLALTRALLGLEGTKIKTASAEKISAAHDATRISAARIMADAKLDGKQKADSIKRIVAFGKDIDPDSNPGLKTYRDAIFLVDRLNALALDPNGDVIDLDTSQMHELAMGQHRIFTGANRTIATQVKALVPETAMSSTMNFTRWFKNEPTGTGQRAFVKLAADTIGREKKVALDKLRDAQKRVIARHAQTVRDIPDDAGNIMKLAGIDPIEGFQAALQTVKPLPAGAVPAPGQGGNLGVVPVAPPGGPSKVIRLNEKGEVLP
jgi:hypothetical protein